MSKILEIIIFLTFQAHRNFNFTAHEYRCTYCDEILEDLSADVLKLIAKFNRLCETLNPLLDEIEKIKLAPGRIEPEPVEFSAHLEYVHYIRICALGYGNTYY